MSVFYEYKDPLGGFDICVLQIEEQDQPNSNIEIPEGISNLYKRRQYAYARQALLCIDDTFPLQKVETLENGKPYVANYDKSFSLSHTSNYAAALLCSAPNCGFDIELPGRRISNIKDKFVSPEEFQHIEGTLRQFFPQAIDFVLYGLCWSMKESVYKWIGKRGIDFRQSMQLYPSENNGNTHIPYLNCKIKLEDEEDKKVSVFMHWERPLVITWVVGNFISSDDQDE